MAGGFRVRGELFELLEELERIVREDPRVLEAIPEPKRSLVMFLLQAYRGVEVGERWYLTPI